MFDTNTLAATASTTEGDRMISENTKIKERPILFKGEMVRAILNGSKTQTRRSIKPQPNQVFKNFAILYTPQDEELGRPGKVLKCPFGQVGNRLWVRETWDCMPVEAPANHPKESLWDIFYDADGHQQQLLAPSIFNPMIYNYARKRPSIFMPRWACRILLEITAIRVERLNQISRGDCMTEGCPFPNIAKETDPVQWYKELWQSINGADSWNTNPWVWVIEFKKIEELKGGE